MWKFSIAAQVLLVAFAPIIAHAEQWIRTQSGCLVMAGTLEPGETVRWEGNCRGGKADGLGRVTWTIEGVVAEVAEFTEVNGVIMREGRYTASQGVNEQAVRLSNPECPRILGGRFAHRRIRADVPREWALWWMVSKKVLDIAHNATLRRCPSDWEDGRNVEPHGIVVQIFQSGRLMVEAQYTGVATEGYGPWSISVDVHSNEVRKKYEAAKEQAAGIRRERAARAEQERRFAEEERRQAERRRAEEAATARRRVWDEFVRSHGIEGRADIRALVANPFRLRGKTVAIVTRFTRMVAEDEAIFGEEILVSQVPSTRFVGGEHVVLAIKVKGTKTVSSGRGASLVMPHADLVGLLLCSRDGCPSFE